MKDYGKEVFRQLTETLEENERLKSEIKNLRTENRELKAKNQQLEEKLTEIEIILILSDG